MARAFRLEACHAGIYRYLSLKSELGPGSWGICAEEEAAKVRRMKEESAGRKRPAVLLLSGGLDSTTILAMAKEKHEQVYALSFRYGQRHEVELSCAARQAKRFAAAAHEVVDLGELAGLIRSSTSLLASSPLSVPTAGKTAAETPSEIPSTYVPARNTLFLAYALSWAEALQARDLWIGANAVDYSGYPDCRLEFLQAFETLANRGTKAGVEGDHFHLHAPLLNLHKHEIIQEGIRLGVDYSDTVSCYSPRESEGVVLACGQCESCAFRREGFKRAGHEDPTRYAQSESNQ